ncbi:P-loop containing nucleoside triphosphate hydrolase protein [Patellaria atrata CBS 101060]|uniref:P-loop containing nucleoside triphosphate hydrolase protein n=1 Tax=Patellaria atrata CBS 101060 TaxID=1346257 RepID=A0A9P4S1R4_9PEZI|nr:P-loop containing nucleoside triphosphate hydrolase protein [Patellaria atrata CBS 101060]
MQDLEVYFDAKTRAYYTANGIPYRRGILLYGPPGTGKTSLSKAIAGHFGLGLHILDLNTLTDEKAFPELREITAQIRATLLSGLLNAIGGLTARDGRLLIMTTNMMTHLDPTLIREGRIDKKYFMGYSTKVTATITLKRLFGTDPCCKHSVKEIENLSKNFGKKVPEGKFTAAEIQAYCMECGDNRKRR